MIHQGLSAELIADQWGYSRQQLDEFSVESHRKALRLKRKEDLNVKSCR